MFDSLLFTPTLKCLTAKDSMKLTGTKKVEFSQKKKKKKIFITQSVPI